jgi:hypothetical protein
VDVWIVDCGLWSMSVDEFPWQLVPNCHIFP